MIFVTVGTSFGFDRLVRAVDEAVRERLVEEEVFAQIGDGAYVPRHCRSVRSLEKTDFDQCIRTASGVVSHAGMGVLTTALEWGKPVLAMPRRKRYGEVVNDHQVAIAEEFVQKGHILVAWEPEDLFREIVRLNSFVPARRHAQVEALVDRIARFLDSVRA